MGEIQNGPFQLSFNASLKVDFQGSWVTSDGGLILVRELDERLGLGKLIAQHLTDSRGKNTQLPLADLLRQSFYSRMAGYEDVNDAERLSQADVPADRFGEDLGVWRSPDVSAAIIRDRLTYSGRESIGGDQSRTDCQGGKHRLSTEGSAGHGLDRDSSLRPAGTQRLQRPL